MFLIRGLSSPENISVASSLHHRRNISSSDRRQPTIFQPQRHPKAHSVSTTHTDQHNGLITIHHAETRAALLNLLRLLAASPPCLAAQASASPIYLHAIDHALRWVHLHTAHHVARANLQEYQGFQKPPNVAANFEQLEECGGG